MGGGRTIRYCNLRASKVAMCGGAEAKIKKTLEDNNKKTPETNNERKLENINAKSS